MAAKETSSTHAGQQSRAAANSGGGNAAISLPAVPVMEQKETEPVTETNPLQLHAMPDAAAAPVTPNAPPPPAVQKKTTTAFPLTSFKQNQPVRQHKTEHGIQSLQLKEQGSNDTASSASMVTAFKPVQKKANNTGLPDNLKSGVENISGYSMDDVKVHYNSPQPKQLQAHAFAQGTDIHVAPGQEQHVAHEAWHVVQQKQGRVKPTIQMKQGVPVNDDEGLEKEADEMGAKALQGKFEARPVQRKETGLSDSSADPVQMKKVSIIGVKIGKTRIYNSTGKAVGHIGKGTEIDIDEGDSVMVGSRTLVKITSGAAGILWNKPDALLDNNEDDIWISNTRYASGDEPKEESEAKSLTLSVLGQEIKLTTDSAEITGTVEKSLEVPFPKVDLSVDFPLPVPVPAYVTIGMDVGLKLTLGVNGTYTVTADSSGQKVNMTATANGKAGMNINVKSGIGTGIANVAGIEAGLFAGASADFDVEGSIAGEVSRNAGKEWLSSSMELKLKSAASLVGKAGAYIKGKILALSKEKKFTLVKKEFAKWEYERIRKIEKEGVRISDIVPTMKDFKILLSPDKAKDYSIAEDVSEKAPLLGKGARSDDD
jgi:hypothetical protein